tara:strand:+ start:168 stop:788 length:621 start_codon:yes stop_codon:yes gene_type:complete
MISSDSFSNQQLNLINYAINNNFETIEDAFRNNDDYDRYYYNRFKKLSNLNDMIIDPYSKTKISIEELANKYIKDYYDALTELNPYDETNEVTLSNIKQNYMGNLLYLMSMNNSNTHIRPISARTNSIDETFSCINDSIDSVDSINTPSPRQYLSNAGLIIINKMNTKKHKKLKKPIKSTKSIKQKKPIKPKKPKKSKKKSLFTNK